MVNEGDWIIKFWLSILKLLINTLAVNILRNLGVLSECLDQIIQRAEDHLLLQFRTLKKKLEEGMVFTEYEQIPKKKANGIFSTAALPENAERSRIREVVPYEENRVELIPTKENNTGYINASHIKVRRGACWEGWSKIAGLTVKMQGGENRRAATVQLGWSPNPEGVFLNSWSFS